MKRKNRRLKAEPAETEAEAEPAEERAAEAEAEPAEEDQGILNGGRRLNFIIIFPTIYPGIDKVVTSEIRD